MTAAIQPTRVYVDSASSRSAGVNRSITTTLISQTLMAANPQRVNLIIKNDTAVDQFINLGAVAVAVPGGGNYKIAAGGFFDLDLYTGAVNIISSGVDSAISAREFSVVF